MAPRRGRRLDVGLQFHGTRRRQDRPAEHARVQTTRPRQTPRLPAGAAPDAIATPAGDGTAARALPYELHVRGEIDFSRDAVALRFKNSGKAAAVFQVRTVKTLAGPWTYTVGAGMDLSDAFTVPDIDREAYALMVHGPNGFLRSFRGRLDGGARANLEVNSVYVIERVGITMSLRNPGVTAVRVRIFDAYTKNATAHDLAGDETFAQTWPLDASFGWYDLTITVDSDTAFERRLAGHVETGKDSMTDPAIGRVAV